MTNAVSGFREAAFELFMWGGLPFEGDIGTEAVEGGVR